MMGVEYSLYCKKCNTKYELDKKDLGRQYILPIMDKHLDHAEEVTIFSDTIICDEEPRNNECKYFGYEEVSKHFFDETRVTSVEIYDQIKLNHAPKCRECKSRGCF